VMLFAVIAIDCLVWLRRYYDNKTISYFSICLGDTGWIRIESWRGLLVR